MSRKSAIAGLGLLAATIGGLALAAESGEAYKVGLRQVEYADPNDKERRLALAVFYPGIPGQEATPLAMPFFTKLQLYRDAEIAPGKFPLVMFSHGRGSNPLYYAWFAELLASHGYIVAGLYHYRANTYDSNIAYLANKLWQRPKDVSLAMDLLLGDTAWAEFIDAEQIGVAGHSQGGFTALWIGGARVNADKYLAFQKGWRNNQAVPGYLREALPLDATPALDVQDARTKAVISFAPGIIKAFGMDEAGLDQLRLPTYIAVGAADTQTPPAENAEFAAEHIPDAELYVIPGKVDHEIFVNECDEEGKDELPEACVDAPGVDRAEIHRTIGAAALKFFAAHLKPK